MLLIVLVILKYSDFGIGTAVGDTKLIGCYFEAVDSHRETQRAIKHRGHPDQPLLRTNKGVT